MSGSVFSKKYQPRLSPWLISVYCIKFDKTMLFPLITITIVPFSAVCNRRHAKMLTKELSKVTAGAKAAVVGDLRNRLIGFC